MEPGVDAPSWQAGWQSPGLRWDDYCPVVDPMCSGTLLVEAAWYALGWPPGRLRAH
ncbi:MAG TPA: hypothetical protein VKK31_09600 [Thermoanaerobaculia bacterium]|nr:hypothetical protein [Thermoanaerobaculia bacterium]